MTRKEFRSLSPQKQLEAIREGSPHLYFELVEEASAGKVVTDEMRKTASRNLLEAMKR